MTNTQDATTVPGIFSSQAAYRQQFVDGLHAMLEAGSLNLFILVCANATADARLYEALKPQLLVAYERLRHDIVLRLREGDAIDVADQDLLVFLKIVAMGFDQITTAQRRMEADWEIQFNQLRAFRPLRNAVSRVTDLHCAFDPAGFNFNKPFMQQETIWTGELLGMPVDLYYNKFPFVDLHALLVPDRSLNQAQFLEADMHRYIWFVLQTLGKSMPNLRIAYNAFGAFASVNHLHFQLCVRQEALPVESAKWSHNGGETRYPVSCQVFQDAALAWTHIERLQAKNQTYNLLYAPGKLYCMARQRQGEAAQPDWSPGLSWYELCGGFITFNRSIYASLSAAQINEALAALLIDV